MTSPVDAFFYGLFMDPDLLRSKGLAPKDPGLGSVADVELRIGQRAALVPHPGARAHGVVMGLREEELEQLYSEPTVADYVAGTVRVDLEDGGTIEARCYNLAAPPPQPPNVEYAAKLRVVAARLGLPAAYVESIGREAEPG